LCAGAAVDAHDSRGETPLAAAANAGHAPVVRLLLAAGADPRVRTRNGDTAIQLALRSVSKH
jgi:ankyrin repeat protein